MATHRRPKQIKRGAAVVTAGSALYVLTQTTAAHAASASTWDRVAQCESSGDWSINTGNGYYGGLQFTASTWAAYGGRAYAPQANQASRAQQIIVAERVLAGQGPGAWPVCGPQAGLSRGGPSPVLGTVTASKQTQTVVPAATARTRAAVAVAFAEAQIGGRYRWGGTGSGGYDCSGLSQAAWRHAGVTIPRTSGSQMAALPRVSLSHLMPGDLVFYYGGAHVAIYVGGGQVVEANNPSEGIVRRYVNYDGHPTAAVRPYGSTGYAATSAGVVVHTGAPQGGHAADPADKPATVHPAAPAPAAGTYTVRVGDNLFEIAMAHHMTGWQQLYAMNQTVVGKDPDLIFPGQVLRLP